MTYERLAYDDADTVDHMADDADAVVAEMHLPKQTAVASAVESVTGLASSLAADAAEAAKRRVVTVSETAAKLAGRLLPF